MTNYLHALAEGYRLGDYSFDRVLGAGAFGITYLARDKRRSCHVAIKEYLPVDVALRCVDQGCKVLPISSRQRADFEWGLKRFLSEARILRRFSHVNIVSVLRHFRANGTGYIVMEYVDGDTLAAYLKDRGTLREKELRGLLGPLLAGLSEVHGANYLHRDLKPGNIMVGRDGTPVILDFGAARQALSTRSQSITSLVTPGYAPIEQYASSGDQGPWTDIYALGAVAYRALTGRTPIAAPERLMDDELAGWTAIVQGVTPGFLDAIDRSLRMDKADRPQSVTEWQRLLDRSSTPLPQAPESSSAPPSVAPEPPFTKLAPVLLVAGKSYELGVRLLRLLQRVILSLYRRSRVAVGSTLEHGRHLAREARRVRYVVWPPWRVMSARRTRLVAGGVTSLVGAISIVSWLALAPVLVEERGIEAPVRATEKTLNVPRWPISDRDRVRDGQPTVAGAGSALTLVRTFTGHGGDVEALAFSPDGETLATAADDGTARVWDVTTGEQMAVLRGHRDAVLAVSYLPGGDRVATAARDSTARIWESETGASIAILEGHGGPVNAVVASPDGSLLVTASDDRTARLWRTRDGRQLATLGGHSSFVSAVGFSMDGTRIVTGGFDKTVRLWDPGLGLHLATFRGGDAVSSAEFSPDGKRVLVAYQDGGTRIWSVDQGQLLATFEGRAGGTNSAAWSPDGTCVALASFDAMLSLWSVSPPRLLTTLKAHDFWLSATAFSPAGDYIATASGDNTAKLWRVSGACA